MRAALNPKQQEFEASKYPYTAVLCPRRAGKSFSLTTTSLIQCEEVPGSRILVICAQKTYARQNYWASSKDGGAAPGGFVDQITRHGIAATKNMANMTWVHANGSTGIVTGVDKIDDVEKLRGAPSEADIIIIDEVGSIPFDILSQLLTVIMPGLMSRKGRLILAGTPGYIPAGTWYEATCLLATNYDGSYTCRLASDTSPERDLAVWRLFTWTIQDNVALPHQWQVALETKRIHRWSDDNPRWRREYLGEWVIDASNMVFHSYVDGRTVGKHVTWLGGTPPEEDGPYAYVGGVDYGFEDDTAITVLAYSLTKNVVYNVYNYKARGLTFDDILALISNVHKEYKVDVFVCDSNQKNITESLRQRGLPMEVADKTEKNTYITLLNSDFHEGRVRIIHNSPLDVELYSLQWDLSKGLGATDAEKKGFLAGKNALHPMANTPDHLCDALLYAWRHCYHHLSVPAEPKQAKKNPRDIEDWREILELREAQARDEWDIEYERRSELFKYVYDDN